MNKTESGGRGRRTIKKKKKESKYDLGPRIHKLVSRKHHQQITRIEPRYHAAADCAAMCTLKCNRDMGPMGMMCMYFSETMQCTFSTKRDEDHNEADSGNYPCRSILQGPRLHGALHEPDDFGYFCFLRLERYLRSGVAQTC